MKNKNNCNIIDQYLQLIETDYCTLNSMDYSTMCTDSTQRSQNLLSEKWKHWENKNSECDGTLKKLEQLHSLVHQLKEKTITLPLTDTPRSGLLTKHDINVVSNMVNTYRKYFDTGSELVISIDKDVDMIIPQKCSIAKLSDPTTKLSSVAINSDNEILTVMELPDNKEYTN